MRINRKFISQDHGAIYLPDSYEISYKNGILIYKEIYDHEIDFTDTVKILKEIKPEAKLIVEGRTITFSFELSRERASNFLIGEFAFQSIFYGQRDNARKIVEAIEQSYNNTEEVLETTGETK